MECFKILHFIMIYSKKECTGWRHFEETQAGTFLFGLEYNTGSKLRPRNLFLQNHLQSPNGSQVCTKLS